MGGRTLGTPNKATLQIKDLARSMLEDPLYRKKLKERLRIGKAQRIEELLHLYAYGKPTQNIEVSAEKTLKELVLDSMTVGEEELSRRESLRSGPTI
jgi:hypothetical protein